MGSLRRKVLIGVVLVLIVHLAHSLPAQQSSQSDLLKLQLEKKNVIAAKQLPLAGEISRAKKLLAKEIKEVNPPTAKDDGESSTETTIIDDEPLIVKTEAPTEKSETPLAVNEGTENPANNENSVTSAPKAEDKTEKPASDDNSGTPAPEKKTEPTQAAKDCKCECETCGKCPAENTLDESDKDPETPVLDESNESPATNAPTEKPILVVKAEPEETIATAGGGSTEAHTGESNVITKAEATAKAARIMKAEVQRKKLQKAGKPGSPPFTTCLKTPEAAAALDPTQRFKKAVAGMTERLMSEDTAWMNSLPQEDCILIAATLGQSKSNIMCVVQNMTQPAWNCVNDTISYNPSSPEEAKEFTGPCIVNAEKWRDRSDTMFLLELKTDETNQKLLSVMTVLIFIVLQFTMLGLGCEIRIDDVMKHAKKPHGAIIAVGAQFGVMPLGAFAVSRLLNLGFYPSIALIICGCCPGGNLSNMLAMAVRGDMNLSILMTTCSSIGGLAAMPLMIWIYGGFTQMIFESRMEESFNVTEAGTSFESDLNIPYANIILNLLATLIPCGIGVFVANKCQNKTIRIVQKIAAGFALLTTIAAVTVIIYLFGIDLITKFDWKVVLACMLLPVTGYICGFTLALLFGQKPNLARTISMETGCQNVQLCAIILRTGFPWCDIGIYFLLPLIYIAFQIGWALVAVAIVRFKYIKLFEQKKKGMNADLADEEIEENYGSSRPSKPAPSKPTQTPVIKADDEPLRLIDAEYKDGVRINLDIDAPGSVEVEVNKE